MELLNTIDEIFTLISILTILASPFILIKSFKMYRDRKKEAQDRENQKFADELNKFITQLDSEWPQEQIELAQKEAQKNSQIAKKRAKKRLAFERKAEQLLQFGNPAESPFTSEDCPWEYDKD